MNIELKIFESVISFAVLVAIVFVLKERKVFNEDEGKTFSKLPVDLVLPATIFFQLASHQILWSQFKMLLSGYICSIKNMIDLTKNFNYVHYIN